MKFATVSLLLIGCAGNGVAEPEHINYPEPHGEVIYADGKELNTICHKKSYKVDDKVFEFTYCAIQIEFNNGLGNPVPYNTNIHIQPIAFVERSQ